MTEQGMLFDLPSPTVIPRHGTLDKPNPATLVYGFTPGKTCRSCRHLEQHSMANTWYKCALRGPSGPGGDHRVRWPACGKFEP